MQSGLDEFVLHRFGPAVLSSPNIYFPNILTLTYQSTQKRPAAQRTRAFDVVRMIDVLTFDLQEDHLGEHQ